MERKIGEKFEYDGKPFVTKEEDKDMSCMGCYFWEDKCCARYSIVGDCCKFDRTDGVSVIFKEVEKNMETKEVKVKIPEGYEVDKKKSSFEEPINIVFKKIEPEIKTWEDLIDIKPKIKGYFISATAQILKDECGFSSKRGEDKSNFIDEKHAKSALAMAQISQLMPYYGGEITDEEWENIHFVKYFISKQFNKEIAKGCETIGYHFLSFRTEKMMDDFFENNEQLVKDYLMLKQ